MQATANGHLIDCIVFPILPCNPYVYYFKNNFLYMPEVICAAIAIYCVVMVSFFLTGTPPVWACIFGVIASCISYRCKLK